MTIRNAKIADIPRILDIIETAHKTSIYAGADEVDRHHARALFGRTMRFNGGHGNGACLFLVSENEGEVHGYFLATLDRVYQLGKKLCANEVHFYMAPEADQRDAIRILNAFMAWGDANPNVIEFRIGESNVLGEPDPRFAALLERKGFSKSASVFTKRVQE